MRRILCIHLPYLPTERMRRDDGAGADEAGRPLVLTRPVGASQVVEQVCPQAAALGLRPGLSLGQAQALAPQVATRPADPPRDSALLLRLARWAIRFSPVVEPVAPGTLLVDVSGCALLFGGEANIAVQAVDGLAAKGFQARAAIADTVGAAWALAVAGSDAHVVVPVEQASAWLAPLPPSALRLDATVCRQLDQLGVRSIGDLLMLPRAALPARFGPELVLRLQQALGEVPEPLAALPPSTMPFSRRVFEEPLADAAALQALAAEMLAEVFAAVRGTGRALRRLEGIVYFERAAPQVVTVGLARASRVERHVAELLRQRLERVDVGGGVIALLLRARETALFRGAQGALFEPAAPEDEEALGTLIDRLAGRLGYEAVVRPQLIDDHQPEFAFRHVTVAETGCVPMPDAGAAPAGQARPLRLLARPWPLRVVALVPAGPPTWLAWGNEEHRVVQALGPERIETAWWRGRDVRRDYFRVSTAAGRVLWVFQALDERRWYLHGWFT